MMRTESTLSGDETANRSRRFPTVTAYILIFAVIMISSSAVRFHNYALKWLLVILVATFFIALSPKVNYANESRVVSIILCSSSAVVLVPLIRSDPNLSPYFTIVSILFLCMLIGARFPIALFMRMYTNVLIFLSGVSLIFFSTGFLAPTLVTKLPLLSGEFSDYRNAILHVYIVSRQAGNEGAVLARNSGIAWEPGAYAVLLLLALIFLLSKIERCGIARLDAGRLALLVLTILSTTSLLGYVGLGVLAHSYRRSVARVMRDSIPFFSLIFAGAIVGTSLLSSTRRDEIKLAYQESSTTFNGRLASYMGDGLDAVYQRLSLDRIDSLHPTLLLVGDSFTKFQETGLVLNNSILNSLIALGVPFTILLLYMYGNLTQLFEGHGITVYLVLVASFANENFFFSFLFLLVAATASIQSSRPERSGFLGNTARLAST